ncbi:MAG: hypothetical protein DCF29_03635 [Alphaproteobacteria bacterium]|nr:MAG: hypothetical protein DCF29_03635 [Alphaproteobacteria bacterium]
MAVNILIGIGGTGAKVVESTLHAAVAGLAGDNLTVGLVDQDGSNGNVGRTAQLLATIVSARALWRSTGGAHVLGGSPLFATDIQSLSPAEEVWIPHPDKAASLARIFDRESMPTGERQLFDGLFAQGTSAADTEQDLPLDEGYRGRPHIGAAAMASRIEDDIEFWDKLTTALDAARGATEVRVLLVGSVFGGTGAAGFPTLARLIRRRLPQGASNVHIGGVLMLPYFDFDPPGRDGDASRDNVALSEELVLQSKSALKHYSDLLRDEPIFDQLYLVGWDRPFALGYHSRGANGQANPPLAPELFGALAACRFFNADLKGVSGQVLASARTSADALTWSDLPSPDNDPDAPYHKLGQLLRFAVAWKHWGPLVSRPRSGLFKAFRTDPWYRRQRIDTIKFDATPAEAEVAALDAYCRWVLGWAGGIELHARRARIKFGLWNTDAFIRPGERPNQPVQVPRAFEGADYDTAYGSIVMPGETGEAPPTAADLMGRLTNETAPEVNQRGLGWFVSALHAFADVQPPAATRT